MLRTLSPMARLLAAVSPCLLLLASGCSNPVAVPARPNVVILLADDLGYGDLASYGHPTIKTPNLDRLAREGLRLTQFYTAASLCTPSRAGLLTGRLPIRNGMTGQRGVLFPDSDGGLPATETTLADALRAQGYATALIGKWHLGHLPEYLPNNHGFGYFFGLPYSNDMRPENEHWDYARQNFPPLPLMENGRTIELSPDQGGLTRRFTEQAVEFIESHATRPFFLYVPYTAPHTPLAVSAERAGESRRGLYGDVVEELDWSVGEIVGTLRRLGLGETTFVIFTSDNGPWAWRGTHGGSTGLLRGAKGSPWEGGYRVPAIAWMPGTVPADAASGALATTLDLFPTILGMSGADLAAYVDIDGLDLLPTFTGRRPVRDEVHYYGSTELVAYRQGPWKLFLRDPNPWSDADENELGELPWLFNVEVDPSEQHNVAAQHPRIAARLGTAARRHEESLAHTPSRIEGILPEYREQFENYQASQVPSTP